MNTPIIRPSLIYLINLCDKFKTALFIVMLVAGFVVVVSLYEYLNLSLIHISEPTRRTPISYAVFCLKKKTSISLLYTSPCQCSDCTNKIDI